MNRHIPQDLVFSMALNMSRKGGMLDLAKLVKCRERFLDIDSNPNNPTILWFFFMYHIQGSYVFRNVDNRNFYNMEEFRYNS